MLTNTGKQFNVTGENIRADAYYGYVDGLHSVQVVYQDFIGGFGLQGTLSLNPKEEDWFWIKITPADITEPFIKYPRNPTAPTGKNNGDTGTEAFSFIGNFTFLRAVVTRDYIFPPLDPEQSYGQVDKVLLSL